MNKERVVLLSLPFLLLVMLNALAAGPVIQPNERSVEAGREAVEKDIRACSKTARALDGPARPDSGISAGGFSTGRADLDDADPIYRNAVERCLSNKGYSVVGWR